MTESTAESMAESMAETMAESMAESTAESPAANADPLRLELKKIMTEILDDGGASEDRDESDGSFGVLKAIDKAVKILNRLREVESKKPDSDISSSSPASVPQVPKQFKCMLSHAIMVEPVVIASGQTYEMRYIKQWLMSKQTCPKTKEFLPHRLLTPNRLIDELITLWCRANKYDRPKPSDEIPIGLFSDDIDSLLKRISSPSSLEDQNKCANELRRQTKRFFNVRALFVAEIPDSITRLLSPLSDLGDKIDSNPDLQKNIITALLYISSYEENKRVVAQHPLVMPLLTKSLKQGTAKTRSNSVSALFSLSFIESNRIIIGNSGAIKALIDVIKEGDFSASIQATYAVFFICISLENMEKAVAEGLIPALTNKIRAGGNVAEFLYILALISLQNGVFEEMEDLGFIDDLFSILRNPICSETCQYAVTIVLGMCSVNTGNINRERTTLELVKEEETKYATFTKLAKEGSDHVVTIAEAILQWIKRSGTGKEPQKG